MGVSVTPKQLLLNYDFDSKTIIFTYLLLGVLLLTGAYATQYFNFKKHFKFSYQHYGVHAAYIAMLAGYFHYYESPVAAAWMSGIAMLSFFLYSDAFKNKSFYFLLLMMLYSYIALSSLVIRIFSPVRGNGAVSLIFMYFIASAIGLVMLLFHFNKKIKAV